MFATPYPDEANSPPARRHEVQQTIGLRQTSLAEVKLRYENAGSDGQHKPATLLQASVTAPPSDASLSPRSSLHPGEFDSSGFHSLDASSLARDGEQDEWCDASDAEDDSHAAPDTPEHHYDLPHNSRETHGSDENRDSGPNGAAMAAIRPRISPNSHFRGLLNQGRAMATAMRAPPLTPHERGALAKQLVQAREETKDLRHRCRAQEVALAAAADERVALEQAVEASATAQAELKDRLQQAEASRRDIGLQEEARTHELQAEVNALQEQLATSQTRLRLAQEDLEEATSEAQVLRRSLARVREESGQALERFDEELSALQQENDEREAALRQRAEEAEARLASQTTTLEIELAQRQDELQERTTEVEVVRARLAVEKERAETHLEAAATRLCTREGELVAKLAASEDRSERLLEQFQGQMAVAERRHQEQERKLYREIEEARVLHGQQQHDAAVAWDAERAELEVRISVLEDELAACTTAPSNPDQGDVMATAMAADSAQAERVRQLEAALANVSGESMEALAGIRKDMIVLRQLAIELQGFASLEVAATTLGNALVTNAGVEQPEDKANEETEVKKTAQVEAATEASLDTEVAVEEEPKKEAETEVGAEPTAEPKKVAENKAESASNRKSALQQAAPDTMHAVILRALQDVNVRHARALSEREDAVRRSVSLQGQMMDLEARLGLLEITHMTSVVTVIKFLEMTNAEPRPLPQKVPTGNTLYAKAISEGVDFTLWPSWVQSQFWPSSSTPAVSRCASPRKK